MAAASSSATKSEVVGTTHEVVVPIDNDADDGAADLRNNERSRTGAGICDRHSALAGRFFPSNAAAAARSGGMHAP